MAPQLPENTTPNTTNVGDATEKSIPDLTDAKAAAALVLETAKKADAFQRAQTNHKRGWHDYQLLLSGSAPSHVFNALCTVPCSSDTYVEDSLNGWNTFNVNGTDNIVNFVTAPPSYGRFPNYKATDRAVQATDGAIIVVQPSPWLDNIDYSFDHIKNSYEGKNAGMYNDSWYDNNEPVTAPSEKELAALKGRAARPVALVLLDSSEGFYVHANYRNYEESLKALRKACATFMRDYGDANQVRLFEITDPKDKTQLNKIVTHLVSDLQEGRGIRFSPPEVRPWDPESEKKFDTLNVKGKKTKASGSNRGLWTRFTKFITGRA